MGSSPSGGGVLAALRGLLATVVEAGELRLDLLGAELALERRRLFEGLLLGILAVMLLTVGLLALYAWVTVLLWEHYRLATLAAIAAFLLCLGGLTLLLAHRRLQGRTEAFAASLALLRRDQARLRGTGAKGEENSVLPK
jgi:uncharacterized membrane protein YqjE